ncbi:MAG: hypothetical protein FWC90_08230 [Oscillospiraceae bacterium]|nr:hypothetical protein [Oscillospiraceae bacterium]
MQLIAMATVNGLFLAILVLGVLLEKRIQRVEAVHENLAELRSRLEALEAREALPAPEQDRAAEQRFTQGVENILNYALRFPGLNQKQESEE